MIALGLQLFAERAGMFSMLVLLSICEPFKLELARFVSFTSGLSSACLALEPSSNPAWNESKLEQREEPKLFFYSPNSQALNPWMTSPIATNYHHYGTENLFPLEFSAEVSFRPYTTLGAYAPVLKERERAWLRL